MTYPYRGGRDPRISKNSRVVSKAYKGDFRDRGSHISGPAEVIAVETFSGRAWRQAVSPDGVIVWISGKPTAAAPAIATATIISTWSPITATIGADLEIPEFLLAARRVVP